jgi:hypothetical protein
MARLNIDADGAVGTLNEGYRFGICLMTRYLPVGAADGAREGPAIDAIVGMGGGLPCARPGGADDG